MSAPFEPAQPDSPYQYGSLPLVPASRPSAESDWVALPSPVEPPSPAPLVEPPTHRRSRARTLVLTAVLVVLLGGASTLGVLLASEHRQLRALSAQNDTLASNLRRTDSQLQGVRSDLASAQDQLRAANTRADSEMTRADSEKTRADSEKTRADAAEARVNAMSQASSQAAANGELIGAAQSILPVGVDAAQVQDMANAVCSTIGGLVAQGRTVTAAKVAVMDATMSNTGATQNAAMNWVAAVVVTTCPQYRS